MNHHFKILRHGPTPFRNSGEFQVFSALMGSRKHASDSRVSDKTFHLIKHKGIYPLGGSSLFGLLEIAFVLLSCYLTFVKMSRRP